MNTDERRCRAEFGHFERGMSNLIGGEVPEAGVAAKLSASVFIRVHPWLPKIV